MIYYSNVAFKTEHLAFIGRWCPFHKGHEYIINKKRSEHPNNPILILIRSTSYDDLSVEERAKIIREWFETNRIKGTIMMMPDITGVYYGRGVGYDIEAIDVPAEISKISATEIRYQIDQDMVDWMDSVPVGTASLVREIYKQHMLDSAAMRG